MKFIITLALAMSALTGHAALVNRTTYNAGTNALAALATGRQAGSPNLTNWSGIVATSLGIQATLGNIYQATNANLTLWSAAVPASYATLASPALTGNPTVPTATAGDNDTSAASTAFVTAAIVASTSTNGLPTDPGARLVVNPSGNLTWVTPRNYIELYDEFVAGVSSGALGWSVATSSGGLA